MFRVVVVYSIRLLNATNKMMLIMSESNVVRYLLRSRWRDLSASSPSNPNTRRTSGLVRRLSDWPSWISPLWRMASMGETRAARRAGIQAENRMVAAENRTVEPRLAARPPLQPCSASRINPETIPE
jgi:hypothetical protein